METNNNAIYSFVLVSDLIWVLKEDKTDEEIELLFSGINVMRENGKRVVDYKDFILNCKYRGFKVTKEQESFENFKKYLEQKKSNEEKDVVILKKSKPKKEKVLNEDHEMVQTMERITKMKVDFLQPRRPQNDSIPKMSSSVWLDEALRIVKLPNKVLKNLIRVFPINKKYDKEKGQVRYAVELDDFVRIIRENGFIITDDMLSECKKHSVQEYANFLQIKYSLKKFSKTLYQMSWKDIIGYANFLEKNKAQNPKIEEMAKLIKKLYLQAQKISSTIPNLFKTVNGKAKSIPSIIETYYFLCEQGTIRIIENEELAIFVTTYEKLKDELNKQNLKNIKEEKIFKIKSFRKPEKKTNIFDIENSSTIFEKNTYKKYYKLCEQYAKQPLSGNQLREWKNTNKKYLKKFLKYQSNTDNELAILVSYTINSKIQEIIDFDQKAFKTDENYLEYAKKKLNQSVYEEIMKKGYEAKKYAFSFIKNMSYEIENNDVINEKTQVKNSIFALAASYLLIATLAIGNLKMYTTDIKENKKEIENYNSYSEFQEEIQARKRII